MPPVRERANQVRVSPEHPLSQVSIEALWDLHDQGAKQYRNDALKPDGSVCWLDIKQELAKRLLSRCNFCMHHCQVNRNAKEIGYCRLTSDTLLAGEYIHYGEEACIAPTHAIFFSGCTLHCVYCQAWRETFHLEQSRLWTAPELVETIKRRQKTSPTKTISFIGGTPEPNLHFILDVAKGLGSAISLPFVFNSNATLSAEGLALMEGIIDIYLPDFKHGNEHCAKNLTGCFNYYETVTENLRTYVRQEATVLVRHLVLPNHLICCTYPILCWLAEEMPQVKVNTLFQYRPLYQARHLPGIDRRLYSDEREQVNKWTQELGLTCVH